MAMSSTAPSPAPAVPLPLDSADPMPWVFSPHASSLGSTEQVRPPAGARGPVAARRLPWQDAPRVRAISVARILRAPGTPPGKSSMPRQQGRPQENHP